MLRCGRQVLYSVIVSAAIFSLRQEISLVGISNACALSGIVFLIMALFRFSRYLRFYDLIFYGFKKFTQIWKNEDFLDQAGGSYADYIENTKHQKNYNETFIAAMCMFTCSIVVLGI